MSKRLGYAREGVAVVIGPIALFNLPMTVTGIYRQQPECGRKMQHREGRVSNTVRQPERVLQWVLSHAWSSRWLLFVMMIMIILCSGTLSSQTVSDDEAQRKTLRFDVTPLVGYRTSMLFPTGHPPSPHFVLGAKPSYGMAVGVRLDEEDVIEFRWARQDTHVHLEGVASSSEKVVLDQFHGDFTHEYILDEGPRWARPFVMGSAGATRVAGKANNSFTRFSFGLGGGIKVYFTRHLGLRVQGEWLPLVVEPEVTSFVCGGGCIVHLSARLVSQGEIVMGPMLRF